MNILGVDYHERVTRMERSRNFGTVHHEMAGIGNVRPIRSKFGRSF
jgi:hypothetical protein